MSTIVDALFRSIWEFRDAVTDTDEARQLEAVKIGYTTVRIFRGHIAAGRLDGDILYDGSSIADALGQIEPITRNIFAQVCHKIVKSATPDRVVALARLYPEYAIGAHSAAHVLLVGTGLRRIQPFDREEVSAFLRLAIEHGRGYIRADAERMLRLVDEGVVVHKAQIGAIMVQDGDTRRTFAENIGRKTATACAACNEFLKTERCARCRTTRYCSRACQRAHWPTHKLVCAA